MKRTSHRTHPIVAVLLSATSLLAGWAGSEANAQQVYANGEGSRLLSDGLLVPLQLDIDSSGNVYAGSGWYPDPADIFRYTPDGRLETFTAPILDPDALAVDSSGFVYVGSWGGRITRIDPATGTQETWLLDSVIGNIDGMKFAPGGPQGEDLFIVSIDRSQVYRVSLPSKSVSVFADLSSLGITGMTGVAIHPVTGFVYVGSPLQNVIVELTESGLVSDAAVASGFAFLGHLAFDLSLTRPLDLWAADNGSGRVVRVDLATGAVSTIVRYIDPHVGGIVFGSGGHLYFDRTSNDDTVGELHELAPMNISFDGTPLPGSTVHTVLGSPADADRPFLFLLGQGDTGFTFADGRRFPLDAPLALLLAARLDLAGQYGFDLTIPDDPQLSGTTFYFAFVARDATQAALVSISEAAALTIQ